MILVTKLIQGRAKWLGMLMVAALLVLGGCGNSQSSSDESSSSSSATSQSSQTNASTQAVQKAKKLIASGEYEQALTTLQDVSAPSTKVKSLISEVKQLIQAESDYKNGNYNSATDSTTTLQKSDINEVQQAAAGLADKITSAKNSDSSSTSSVTSSGSTSSSSNSSSSATTDENSIISKFASAVGYYGKSGYSFTIDGQSGQTYTIEVRKDNQDGSVANLVGIYQYNASTGAVTKTN